MTKPIDQMTTQEMAAEIARNARALGKPDLSVLEGMHDLEFQALLHEALLERSEDEWQRLPALVRKQYAAALYTSLMREGDPLVELYDRGDSAVH